MTAPVRHLVLLTTDDLAQLAVAGSLCLPEARFIRELTIADPRDDYAPQTYEQSLRTADGQVVVESDSHYDRDGYCDNPGRGF